MVVCLCKPRTLLTGFYVYGANQKPYPEADENVRLILAEEGTITGRTLQWDINFSKTTTCPLS